MAGPHRGVLVLCYHAVSTTWPADLSVTPARFRAQVEAVLRLGYRPVTFAEAVQAQPGERVVAVTFDDGYRSVLDLAGPILAELGAPGTMFVPTDHMGTGRPMTWPGIDQWMGTPHEPELLPLDWDELLQLQRDGWEIGSHTLAHPRLTELDDATLERELRESKAVCEARLGRSVPSVCYPYGDVDARVVRAADACGYRFGAALPGPWRDPRALEWPRVGVWHNDAFWRFGAKLLASRALGDPQAGGVVDAVRRRRTRARDSA